MCVTLIYFVLMILTLVIKWEYGRNACSPQWPINKKTTVRCFHVTSLVSLLFSSLWFSTFRYKQASLVDTVEEDFVKKRTMFRGQLSLQNNGIVAKHTYGNIPKIHKKLHQLIWTVKLIILNSKTQKELPFYGMDLEMAVYYLSFIDELE